MFENIGEKIKGLAKVICVIGIIISVIFGLYFLAGEENPAGVIFMLIGPIASWASTLVLYGFGELIDRTTEISKDIKDLHKE